MFLTLFFKEQLITFSVVIRSAISKNLDNIENAQAIGTKVNEAKRKSVEKILIGPDDLRFALRAHLNVYKRNHPFRSNLNFHLGPLLLRILCR